MDLVFLVVGVRHQSLHDFVVVSCIENQNDSMTNGCVRCWDFEFFSNETVYLSNSDTALYDLVCWL